MRNEKLINGISLAICSIILVTGFIFVDWNYYGQKISAEHLAEGPALVRISSKEDKIIVLKKGESYKGKGGEILFSNLTEADLQGWEEVISLPE